MIWVNFNLKENWKSVFRSFLNLLSFCLTLYCASALTWASSSPGTAPWSPRPGAQSLTCRTRSPPAPPSLQRMQRRVDDDRKEREREREVVKCSLQAGRGGWNKMMWVWRKARFWFHCGCSCGLHSTARHPVCESITHEQCFLNMSLNIYILFSHPHYIKFYKVCVDVVWYRSCDAALEFYLLGINTAFPALRSVLLMCVDKACGKLKLL